MTYRYGTVLTLFPEVKVDSMDSPLMLTRAEVRSRLAPNVILLHNPFEEQDHLKEVKGSKIHE